MTTSRERVSSSHKRFCQCNQGRLPCSCVPLRTPVVRSEEHWDDRVSICIALGIWLLMGAYVAYSEIKGLIEWVLYFW